MGRGRSVTAGRNLDADLMQTLIDVQLGKAHARAEVSHLAVGAEEPQLGCKPHEAGPGRACAAARIDTSRRPLFGPLPLPQESVAKPCPEMIRGIFS